MAEHGHEQVVFCFDRQTGMRAIIAIHDTALGPARGGTRYKAYASEEDALEDALRLSRGMTYKFAFTDLPRGGGRVAVPAGPEALAEPDGVVQEGAQVHGVPRVAGHSAAPPWPDRDAATLGP
jgi:glutamate dehydrogenase/leucine dehydrogenase